MSAPVTAGDRAREVLARVLSEHYDTSSPWFCECGQRLNMMGDDPTFEEHAADLAVTALTEAGLLVEGVERVEWGVRRARTNFDAWFRGDEAECREYAAHAPSERQTIRRTRTTYPHRVTEWEEVE